MGTPLLGLASNAWELTRLPVEDRRFVAFPPVASAFTPTSPDASAGNGPHDRGDSGCRIARSIRIATRLVVQRWFDQP